jgi:hypothetical protein
MSLSCNDCSIDAMERCRTASGCLDGGTLACVDGYLEGGDAEESPTAACSVGNQVLVAMNASKVVRNGARVTSTGCVL